MATQRNRWGVCRFECAGRSAARVLARGSQHTQRGLLPRVCDDAGDRHMVLAAEEGKSQPSLFPLPCNQACKHVHSWPLRVCQTEVIAARSPHIMCGVMASLALGTALDQLPPLWDTQFYCTPSNRPVRWVRTTALLAYFPLALWACLRLITRFETQRLRLALALREQGMGTARRAAALIASGAHACL